MTDGQEQQAESNPTVEAVIARLPKGPMVTPLDIAVAIGFKTSVPVIRKIESGELKALNYGCAGRALYFIRREDAVNHLKSRASGNGQF